MQPLFSGSTRMQVERETRDRWLGMADSELLRLCRVECMRGSGRGGQHRNVTDTAVRITHGETSLRGYAEDTRSQAANRELALRRLRRAIALECRAEPAATCPGPWCPGRKAAAYLPWLAWILDVLEAHGMRVSDAAAHCGVSTGRLVRDLAQDEHLWQQVNTRRRALDLKPLRQ